MRGLRLAGGRRIGMGGGEGEIIWIYTIHSKSSIRGRLFATEFPNLLNSVTNHYIDPQPDIHVSEYTFTLHIMAGNDRYSTRSTSPPSQLKSTPWHPPKSAQKRLTTHGGRRRRRSTVPSKAVSQTNQKLQRRVQLVFNVHLQVD